MRGKTRTTILLMFSIALVLLIMGCTGPADGGADYKDGTFKGVSENGNAEVTLMIENGEIKTVEIMELDREGNVKDIETYLVCVDDDNQEPLLAEAHPTLIQQIVEKNSWDVDIFTGATGSSNSIREAAEQALQAAK